MLTREQVLTKFYYNPKLDKLYFKPDSSKGDDWNIRNVGKEANPIYSGGNKYLFVFDSLYRWEQLTLYWFCDEEDIEDTSTTTEELLEEQKEEREAINKLPLEDLLKVQEAILNDDIEKARFIIKTPKLKVRKAKALNIIKTRKQIRKGRPKPKPLKIVKSKRQLCKGKFKHYTKVVNLLDTNDLKVNPKTGLPKNIYFSSKEGYRVRVKYFKNQHTRGGINTIVEAILIRNALYEELLEAEKNGENMNSYVSKNGRKEVRRDYPLTNPFKKLDETDPWKHIYNKGTGFKVEFKIQKFRFHCTASHYVEAKQKRDAMYDEIKVRYLNGESIEEIKLNS